MEVLLVASLFVLALGLVYGPFSASLAHVRASCAAADLDDDLILTRTVAALAGTQGKVVLPGNERERAYRLEFASADSSLQFAEGELPPGVVVRGGGTIAFGRTGRLRPPSHTFTLVEKGGRERPYGISAQTGRLYER
ncbi:hypothetical protein C7438_0613 [Brockia lithotrophica]|uniref:Tfp pilus assembly protein FimT n=1 Tax=Brockia lithotrophica TaxID=933949 RepID=A0A660LBI0_9BACL|nr:hypothetical protein C7438_0613 [Brockia lithotrophica]